MTTSYVFDINNTFWQVINDKLLRTGRIILFLDYDGTLTEIQSTPELAVLSGKMKKLLQKISHCREISVIIVTGRAYQDIFNLIRLNNITYISNHGFLITGDKMHWVHPSIDEHLLLFPKIVSDLKTSLVDNKGTLIEDKGFSISIHYRNANPNEVQIIKNKIERIIHKYKNNIKLTEGKKVFELSPPVIWNKGTAVLEWLCKQQVILDNPPLIISIGDDKTDEDMFLALNNIGITIKVGVELPTKASFYLLNSNEVYRFLFQLYNMSKTMKYD